MNTADRLQLADRCLLIHMQSVTNRAPIRRRRKQRHGPALTITIVLTTLAVVVFGRGIF